MKTIFTFLAILFINFVSSQTFLNGDFESNTQTSCAYNLSNADFNNSIDNVYSYSTKAQPDIMTNNCTVSPQNGNWCIGVANWTISGHDNINIEFSSALEIDSTYKISFWAYGNSTYLPVEDSVIIGLSTDSTSFGDEFKTFLATDGIWEEHVIEFTATANYMYLSIQVKEDFHKGWTQLDNFKFKTDTTTTPTPTPTNLATLKNKDLVNIFPNPTNDYLNIELNEIYSNTILKILNSIGEIVYQNTYLNSNYMSVNIRDLEKGVYFVEVETKNNKLITKLLKK